MRTIDELPEKFTHDDIRAANAKHWDQPGGGSFANGVPPPAASTHLLLAPEAYTSSNDSITAIASACKMVPQRA
jgi:hypothetical protein